MMGKIACGEALPVTRILTENENKEDKKKRLTPSFRRVRSDSVSVLEADDSTKSVKSSNLIGFKNVVKRIGGDPMKVHYTLNMARYLS